MTICGARVDDPQRPQWVMTAVLGMSRVGVASCWRPQKGEGALQCRL